MATKKTEEVTEEVTEEHVEGTPPDPWERVPLYIPPASSSQDDPNVFVSINGRNYVIPKGMESMVPRCVAEEYKRAGEAQKNFNNRMVELAKQSAEL